MPDDKVRRFYRLHARDTRERLETQKAYAVAGRALERFLENNPRASAADIAEAAYSIDEDLKQRKST